jgi:hypothetical protein
MRASPGGVYGVSERLFRGAFVAFLLALVVGCSEQVTGSLGCPALCTDQAAALRDTTLSGVVVLDTTLLGFPPLGTTRDVTLLNLGDTADVRLIARFDTLPNLYRPSGAASDSAIARVDSATFVFVVDTLVAKPKVPITIDAFDVDTTANDTLPSTLVPLFRADRLLGSQTYQPAEVKDTLRLALSNAALLVKIQKIQRLRIGLRIRGASSVKLRVVSSAFAPRVRFRVSADTTVKPDTVTLLSRTPTADPGIAGSLVIYPLVAKGALPLPAAGRISVGGLAGARSYLRFDIPSIVLDSVQVVRASLVLTQLAGRTPGGSGDSLTIYAAPVIASPSVTDVRLASQFLGSGAQLSSDSLRLVSRDIGVRSIELVNIVRVWQLVGTTNTSRALVLYTPAEGTTVGELSFASTEAVLAQRPQLRITYVPRRGFGLP